MKQIKVYVCCMFFICIGSIMLSEVVHAASVTEYDYIVTDVVDSKDKQADAKGIQSILNKAIGSQEVVTIYFPAGKYYIDKTLKVYSNTHIILDKDAIVYRMDSIVNNMLIHNVDQNGKMDVIGGYDMSKNITLEGGTWDGGNVKLATDATNVIRFDHAQNIVIKNCTVKNTYDCHIVEFVGVKNGLISNCTFSGFRYRKGKEKNYTYAREAIQLDSAWTNNEKDLSDESSHWAKNTYIDGTSCKQITVCNNTFTDLPCGVGQHHYTDSGKYRNEDIIIKDNVFNCSSSMKYCKTAITASGTNNLTIYNNKVKGPYRFAVHVIASDDVMIQQNEIYNSSINGIMIDKGNKITVVDNVVGKVKKHGISVGGGLVTDVSDNEVSATGQNGICISGGTVNNITNNVVTSAGKHGISLSGFTAGKSGASVENVSNNTIKKSKQNGICIDKGKIGNVTKNTITSAGKHGISVTGSTNTKKCVNITNISNNKIHKSKQNGIVGNAGIIKNVAKNTIKDSGRHGISFVGGTIGSDKKKTNGIQSNTITKCKLSGITISGTTKVSAIAKNKITNVKKNGISLSEKAKVQWIIKNTIKKCSKYGIWNGTSTKTKISGNKGKIK